ncbi:Alanine racemase [Microbacterium terrae]|uniref:Alanine racemase n=1 Tax=Microbacterium terrae TaxID=69369 RepID=A0A0M2GW19_9MICO|nr:Alanine racemase [Microbacterium terrae]
MSRTALTANLRMAQRRSIRAFAPSLLDADAWGHGAGLVQEVLDSASIPPADAAGARDLSTTAADRGAPTPAPDTLTASMLFGMPASGATPALRLSGSVLSVKALRAGEGVSYGFLHRADRDTRVALVTGGYAQGIFRELGGRVEVAIAGERHPIIGRVAMDVCVVDVGEAAVARGDEVLFLGDPAQGEPALDDWVLATGLDPAELITAVGLRCIREAAP